jgi:hypothetical protein
MLCVKVANLDVQQTMESCFHALNRLHCFPPQWSHFDSSRQLSRAYCLIYGVKIVKFLSIELQPQLSPEAAYQGGFRGVKERWEDQKLKLRLYLVISSFDHRMSDVEPRYGLSIVKAYCGWENMVVPKSPTCRPSPEDQFISLELFMVGTRKKFFLY